MEMTKELKIINVFGENVTIDPIEYDVALNAIHLKEKSALLLEESMKIARNLIEENVENFKENEWFMNVYNQHEKIHSEEMEIREKYDYWYCGIDNLKTDDIEQIKELYPRRKNL